MTLNNLYIIGGLLLSLYFIAGMGFLLFSREYILYIFYLELMYLIIMYSITILAFFLNYDLLYSIMVVLVIATIENCILILILVLLAQEEEKKIVSTAVKSATKDSYTVVASKGTCVATFSVFELFNRIYDVINNLFPHWLLQSVVWVCIIWAILYGMGRGGEALQKCNMQIVPGVPSPAILLNDMKMKLVNILEVYKVHIIFVACLNIDFILNYVTFVNFFGLTRLNSFFGGFVLTFAILVILGLLLVISNLYHSTHWAVCKFFFCLVGFTIGEVITDAILVGVLLIFTTFLSYILFFIFSVLQVIYKFVLNTYVLDFLLLYVLTLLPVLLSVAYVILWERKLMASVQRRRGPNVVGIYGLLQPIIDAVKLLIKEVLIPNKVNQFLFILGPTLTLVVALTLWTFIPFSVDNYYYDYEYGLLLFLGVSSLGPYGIIVAGWSSNSSYAALGAIRSIAQFISYEAIIGLLVLPIIMYCESLNFIEIVLFQEAFMWFFFPLFPVCVWFFVAILAETNRTPFDLPEAEAELVAGYNTEYAGVFFIMFMLAEYSNILCMSALITILFFGGWTLQWFTILFTVLPSGISLIFFSFLPELILSVKLVMVTFLFILVRATLPRFRFDQLMFYCWCNLLPLILGTLLLLIFVYILTTVIGLTTFV